MALSRLNQEHKEYVCPEFEVSEENTNRIFTC